MRKICNKKPSLVLVATTGHLPCIISHILFPIFLNGSKKLTNVSSLVTIFANCLWFWIWKYSKLRSGLFSYLFLIMSIFTISIWQKSFVLSKYAWTWNVSAIAICQQLWQYHESCICHHSQLFPWLLRHLPFLIQSQVGKILQHLWRTLCQSETFSNYELSLIIPYQTHKLPPIQ